jgi:hypothetical protein
MSKITKPGFLTLPIAGVGRLFDLRALRNSAKEGGEGLIFKQGARLPTQARAGVTKEFTTGTEGGIQP